MEKFVPLHKYENPDYRDNEDLKSTELPYVQPDIFS